MRKCCGTERSEVERGTGNAISIRESNILINSRVVFVQEPSVIQYTFCNGDSCYSIVWEKEEG